MRVPALLVLLVAALPACAGGEERVVPDGSRVASGLRQAEEAEARFYFAGPEVEGLPLTDVRVIGAGRAYFGYGTCTLPEGEGGCAVPVQIQVSPFEAAAWRAATGCTRLPSILGVPTARHDGLVLFTGRSIVKVYAPSPAEERAVAAALRRVDRPEEPLSALPPPAAEVRQAHADACPP